MPAVSPWCSITNHVRSAIDKTTRLFYIYIRSHPGEWCDEAEARAPQTRSVASHRHSASAPGSGERPLVSLGRFFRFPGFAPGQIRNAPACAGREASHSSCGTGFRILASVRLPCRCRIQAQRFGGACSSEARTTQRAQAQRGSHGLYRSGVEGGLPASCARAGQAGGQAVRPHDPRSKHRARSRSEEKKTAPIARSTVPGGVMQTRGWCRHSTSKFERRRWKVDTSSCTRRGWGCFSVTGCGHGRMCAWREARVLAIAGLVRPRGRRESRLVTAVI